MTKETVDGTPGDDARYIRPEDLVPDVALKSRSGDEFNHSAIAGRITELVESSEEPLNIGLFGAWGSGKSSLAGLIDERLHGSEIAYIYYDAWKYGGHSLKRNFISHAASSLGMEREDQRWHRFHRGLYETRRTVLFKPGNIGKLLWAVAWRFLVLFVGLGVVFSVGVGALSLLTTENFIGEIERSLPAFLSASGLLAFVAAVAKVVLDTGKVDVEESAPSDDEEFSETFSDLIAEVRKERKQPWWKPLAKKKAQVSKLVFFIDELDRCTEEDVVETLVAIRTFLDEDHCYFIVAADRAVLEAALKRRAQQATPRNRVDPYYSTAGAFLDKIFAHQQQVPPLRTRRLARFARDLVQERGGLWKELRDASGTIQLDHVILTLVPPHISSPRRVKVLLNNFATQSRIAQSRGIAWPARAPEIAKLTVLQTEFPKVAADLVEEPKLLEYLFYEKTEREELPQRVQDLLDRHDFEEGTESDFIDRQSDKDQADSSDTKEVENERKAMRARQGALLEEYLRRHGDVIDPRRDLLYLEAAGEAVGLTDPAVGDLLESVAPSNPTAALKELDKRGLSLSELNGAVRLLADIARNTISTDQTKTTTALTGLCYQLGQELTVSAAADACRSLKQVEEEQGLTVEQAPGAISAALSADDEVFVALLEQSVGGLWEDAAAIEALIGLAPRIVDAELRGIIFTGAGHLLIEEPESGEAYDEDSEIDNPGHHAGLLDAMLTLESDLAIEALENDRVTQGIKTLLRGPYLSEEEQAEIATSLLEAALGRDHESALLDCVLTLILDSDSPTGRAEVIARVTDVLTGLGEMAYDRLASMIESAGTFDEAADLVGHFAASEAPTDHAAIEEDEIMNETPEAVSTATEEVAQRPVDPSLNDRAINRLLQLFGQGNVDQQENAPSLVRRIGETRALGESEESAKLVETVRETVGSFPDWAQDEQVRGTQERFLATAIAVTEVHPDLRPLMEQAFVDDLIAMIEGSLSSVRDPNRVAVVLRGLRRTAPYLTEERLQQVANAIPVFPETEEPVEAAAEMATRAVLTLRRRKELSVDTDAGPFGIDERRLLAVLGIRDGALASDQDEALDSWLRLGPTSGPVRDARKAQQGRLGSLSQAGLSIWATRAERSQRTAVLEDAVKGPSASTTWIEVVSQAGEYTETRVLRALSKAVLDGQSDKERTRAANKAKALKVRTGQGGGELSKLASALLGKKRRKSDIEVALIIISATDKAALKSDKLSRELREACKRHKKSLTEAQGRAFEAKGIKPPKDAFGTKVAKKLKFWK